MSTFLADLSAVKTYVAANYKQLAVAAVAGKFSSALVAAAVALVKAL